MGAAVVMASAVSVTHAFDVFEYIIIVFSSYLWCTTLQILLLTTEIRSFIKTLVFPPGANQTPIGQRIPRVFFLRLKMDI